MLICRERKLAACVPQTSSENSMALMMVPENPPSSFRLLDAAGIVFHAHVPRLLSILD